jgi:hypothetical protein
VSNVQWFVPGVLLSAVLGLALCGRVGRALGTRPAIAWLLLVGFGLVTSATLTPVRDTLETPSAGVGTCDLSRFSPAPVDQLLVVGDTSLNVALFVPVGTAIGLLPATRRKVALALWSTALPFAIEWIQLVATPLNRGCQSADVADNLTGLVLGLVIGLGLLRRVVVASPRPSTADGRGDPPSGRG